ncbi:MAG: LysR family transcriptional regulator [Candidatus Omnitrophota bacterium]
MQVKSKIWFEKDGELVFGIGKSLILKAIGETGSINKAAKKMEMSYRHAWSYVRSAERRLGKPLLIKVKGGKEGGGAVLTDYAKDLVEKFEKLEQDVTAFTDRHYREIFL